MVATGEPGGAPSSSSGRRSSLWRDLLAAPEFYRERKDVAPTRFEAIFEPVVLISTALLFAQGLVQFGLALAPGWRVGGLMPLCAAVAVAAYLYSRRLARGVVIWREWLVLLALPILIARLTPYVEGDDLVADLSLWLRTPLSFFDLGFVARASLLLTVWLQLFRSTQDLNDVRVQPGEIPELPARTVIERAWESDRLRAIDHTTPFRRLMGRFLSGGVLLIVFAALTASNVRQLLSVEAVGQLIALGRPSSALALINVVAYFMATLLLLAEAQYVRSRTLWQLDRVEIAPGLARQWGLSSLLLVGAGLVAALLAPTEGLLGIGEIVRIAAAALVFLASVTMVGVYLLFWLLTYPLRWLLGTGGDEGPSAPPIAPPPMMPPQASDGSLFELLKSALFWLLMAGVLTYALIALWRQGRLRALLPSWLGRLGERALAALGLLLAWLARLGRRAGRGAVEAVRLLTRARLGGRGGRARGALSGLLPGRDPRWIVIAIYGLLVTRAGERGLERRTGQTPLEYRQRLREGVPQAAAEVDRLTEAFVRARYAPRPVGAEDASLARRCWEQIRAQLRRPAARS
ncbi:MAG TPA: DUF4129 domain-containing protein [Chloroflexota bacterium]